MVATYCQVIALNVTTDPLKKIDITTGAPLNVRFSYSVAWVPTAIPFSDRMQRYTQVRGLPHPQPTAVPLLLPVLLSCWYWCQCRCVCWWGNQTWAWAWNVAAR